MDRSLFSKYTHNCFFANLPKQIHHISSDFLGLDLDFVDFLQVDIPFFLNCLFLGLSESFDWLFIGFFKYALLLLRVLHTDNSTLPLSFWMA